MIVIASVGLTTSAWSVQARSMSHSFSPLFNSSSCRIINSMCFTRSSKPEDILNSTFRMCSVLIERCTTTLVQKRSESCQPIYKNWKLLPLEGSLLKALGDEGGPTT